MELLRRRTCEVHPLEIFECARHDFVAFWNLDQVVLQDGTAGLLPVWADSVQWVDSLSVSVDSVRE